MTGQGTRPATFKEHLAERFGMAPESILSTSPDCKASLEMARVSFDNRNFGEVFVNGREPGFLLSVQLGELHAQRVYKEKCSDVHVYGRNSIDIQHLKEDYRADFLTPFDFIVCYISRKTINAVADEMGEGDLTFLACNPATLDPVTANLCRALLPALHRREKHETIFVDLAATALISHLMKTYGTAAVSRSSSNGGLAQWQKRRAIEMLSAAGENRSDMSITDIASECRLSRSYFVRAFKKSTGLPPQRWLADYRLRRARHLLAETDEPIAEVADRCGFADQAHLTRAFASAVGLTPAAWRRHIKD